MLLGPIQTNCQEEILLYCTHIYIRTNYVLYIFTNVTLSSNTSHIIWFNFIFVFSLYVYCRLFLSFLQVTILLSTLFVCIFVIKSFFILFADCPGDENISIILNGIESELKFITDSKGNKVKINLYRLLYLEYIFFYLWQKSHASKTLWYLSYEHYCVYIFFFIYSALEFSAFFLTLYNSPLWYHDTNFIHRNKVSPYH